MGEKCEKINSMKTVNLVKAQSGEIIDSTGQMLHYDKPALHGLYLLREIHFYKIIKTENYMPLVPVKEEELALLKFYTAK